ncbi:MAG: hypothetical protein CBC48_02800 [bacterium TMED88]|nr:hypothetical protein [Deltaproteobacteria bacterium]OUV36061.1 MAG: hypothetical protein CBC48_02800 [bacterium TMED88]
MESVRVWSSTWNLDPFLIITLVATGVVYVRGFRRVRTQLPSHFPAWRRDVFLLALGILFFALTSPLDGLADLLLQAHMAQHWLLVMVVAPLVWLGAPSVPLMRGLPGQALQKGLGPLLASPAIRSAADRLTRPTTAWCLWAATILVWHWPPAYQAALRSQAWHDFEHASFLAAALLLWYPIVRPWPKRGADPVGGRLIYIAATMVFNTFFSATFAFSGQVFYEAYETVPRPWAISALRDQNAAGAFMWIASSIPMLMASVAVVVQWLSPGYSRPSTPPRVIKADRRRGNPQWIFSLRLRRGIQVGLFLLAIIVVIDGLTGTSSPSAENLAGVLPWTYWRGFVVIGLVALGNLFCAVCPFTLPRQLAAKILGRRFRWPAALQNKWLAAGLFGLYLWAYEVLALWDRPSWTAWLILGYFLFAFMIEGLFPRGTFCRFLCPIGQFNFTGANLSPLEVTPLETSVCSRCTTRECLHGDPNEPGCPTGLLIPAKTGNHDCTFCMDCARACPHENVTLSLVRPGHGIGHDRMAKQSPGLDVVALTSLITFGAFVNAAAMIEPVVRFEERLATQINVTASLVQTFWILGGITLGPILILSICAALGQRLSRLTLSNQLIIRKLAPALIPMGFAMWLAHAGFHLVTAYGSLIPATRSFMGGAPQSVDPIGFSLPRFDGVELELLILGFGFLIAMAIGWRISLGLADSTSRAFRLALPWVVTAFLLYLAGAWIVLQPMQMRGMAM